VSICNVEAQQVFEMQDGDRAGIPPGAVRADLKRKLYVISSTYLWGIGEGLVTIERRGGAYYLDLGNVPGVRFSRNLQVPDLRRVKGVTGGCCI
jgi:hypothetical protein